MTQPAPDTVLPPDAAPSVHAPVAAQDRALLPDALRGFALLGIALINVQDFAGFRMWEQQGLDRAVQVMTDVLFNGKSITLFAMLFGWGAAGLWERHGAALYIRRHLLLLVIGLLHFALLWHGDIIAGYAVGAFIFMLLLRFRATALLRWAWGLYLLGVLNYVAGYGMFSTTPGSRQLFSETFAPGQSYASMLQARLAEVPEQVLSGVWLASITLPLFAFGGWAYRSGLLTRPAEHLPLLRRLLGWGLGLGIPLSLGLAYLNTVDTEQAGLLSEGMRLISGLPMAFGYVGLFGLAVVQRPGLPALQALSNSGRLALTHYISQSIVLTSIFYPYTFDLRGHVGAAAAVGTALVLALAQIALSRLYLARYGRGPLESLLRWAVYGRR